MSATTFTSTVPPAGTLNGVPEKVYVPALTVGWVVPNCTPFTKSFKFWSEEAVKPVLGRLMLTVETFTPSAVEAVSAYDPISWPVEFFDKTCVPKLVFCVTVRLEFESVKALPLAPDESADWLEIWPCKLLLPVSFKRFAVTVVKFAVV
jgi:hypothetical protein